MDTKNMLKQKEQTAVSGDAELASGETPAPADAYGKSMRVIQPLSSGLEAASPSVGHVHPPAAPGAERAAAPAEATAAAPQHPNPSSVYPVPTAGMHASADAAPPHRPGQPAESASDNTRRSPANWPAVAIGMFIIAAGGLCMLAWLYAVHSAHNFIIGGKFTPSSEGSMALAGCCILLGVGIIFRRETARALYTFAAVSLLILTVYTTYIFQRDARLITEINNGFNANIDTDIAKYKNNPAYVSQLKARQKSGDASVHQYYKRALPLLAAYAVTVVPLVFLNLPRVKDTFN